MTIQIASLLYTPLGAMHAVPSRGGDARAWNTGFVIEGIE